MVELTLAIPGVVMESRLKEAEEDRDHCFKTAAERGRLLAEALKKIEELKDRIQALEDKLMRLHQSRLAEQCGVKRDR
jgi:uncharacterized coiled-coil protein SlyX